MSSTESDFVDRLPRLPGKKDKTGAQVQTAVNATLRSNDGVHRGNCQSIIWNFWYEDSAERDALIDRALDAERQSYIRATKASGGTTEGVSDDFAENLPRLTEKGFRQSKGHLPDPIAYAMEPTQIIEQDEQYEAEAAAFDAREQEAAKEFEIMKEKIKAYSETLRLAHRKALSLIYNEPKLTNSTIAAKVSLQSARGIAPATVSKLRDKFYSMADKVLSLMEDPEDALNKLVREVETLQREVAAIKAERRRDAWLRTMSVEQFEAARVWIAPFCEALGTTADDLLGATISGGPKPST